MAPIDTLPPLREVIRQHGLAARKSLAFCENRLNSCGSRPNPLIWRMPCRLSFSNAFIAELVSRTRR